ncbi:MAG: hypothetical protein WDA75_23335 [Candidatus Latescibacterota bacterium]|jgi:hypothetical protein
MQWSVFRAIADTGPARVVDATTGRTVLQAGTGFTVRLAPRSTAIWLLHDV